MMYQDTLYDNMTKDEMKQEENWVRKAGENEYMNDRMLRFFYNKLIKQKNKLTFLSIKTLEELKNSDNYLPDEIDQAMLEQDRSFDLRCKDRMRKLIEKIDIAIYRIAKGVYGYCEETEEPIGVRRLLARPMATLCIEAQERHERFEKSYNKIVYQDFIHHKPKETA